MHDHGLPWRRPCKGFLCAGAASGGVAMFSPSLNRRAWQVAICAEDAAVPSLWLQEHPTVFAFVKELAAVARHYFSRLMTARRTDESCGKLHSSRSKKLQQDRVEIGPARRRKDDYRSAKRRSASVTRERSGGAQLVVEAHPTERFSHHAPHPPTIAKALMESRGTRQAATASSPPRTPALAPSAASPSGTTQQGDAMIAPRPVTSPKAANHFGEVGGEGLAGVISCVASLMAIARSLLKIELSCTL